MSMNMRILTIPLAERKTGTITSLHSPGFWMVTDSIGRVFMAASGEPWRIGDRVAVINGQITGGAGIQDEVKIYEV